MESKSDVTSKRAEMIAMLESRKAERGAAKETRRTAMEAARTESGAQNVALSSDEFWAIFNEAVKAFRAVLDKAQKGTVSEDEGKAMWQAWMEQCADIQAQLNDCTLFLAAFDVRKAQTIVDSLLDSAEGIKAKIMPRRKFAFSKKATSIAAAQRDQAAAGSTSAPMDLPTPSSAADSTSRLNEDELTIEGKSGEVIVVERGHYTAQARAELAQLEVEIARVTSDGSPVPALLSASRRRLTSTGAGRDLRLLSLTDCTVLLMDPLRAVRVDGLTRCTLITGTVAGSVLLHNCEDCTFHFAARQLRLHTSTRCDFYLHCLSRPIIEHCTALRFAPYGIHFTGLDTDVVSAGLDKPARPDLWRSVDDFGWHRVQASPNWSVLPVGQRMGEKGGKTPPHAAAERGVSFVYPAALSDVDVPAVPAVSSPAARVSAPSAEPLPKASKQAAAADDDDEL